MTNDRLVLLTLHSHIDRNQPVNKAGTISLVLAKLTVVASQHVS